MERFLLWTIRTLVLLLKWIAHRPTPNLALTTLSFGALIALMGFGLTLLGVSAGLKSRSMLAVLALWAMACLSTLLWFQCILALHSVGLV